MCDYEYLKQLLGDAYVPPPDERKKPMTVRPTAALLRFQGTVAQAASSILDKDERAFTDDLGAVLHWLSFAESSLGDRDALLTDIAEALREEVDLGEGPQWGALLNRIEKLLGLETTNEH